MSTRIVSPRELQAHKSAKLESSQALRKLGVGVPSLLKVDLSKMLQSGCLRSLDVFGHVLRPLLGGEKGPDSRAKGETTAISGCHTPGEGHLT